MFETVSVDEALKRGRRTINVPVLIIILGIMALGFVLGAYVNSGWIMGGGFVLSLLLAWLYWSVMIPRWRVWAFDNVRNVHELKKRAISEQLIYKDGSFFEKTEIWSAADKAKWISLQDKFNVPDVFIDDYSVPTETVIYYSKLKTLAAFFTYLLFLIAGIYFLITDTYRLLGGFAFLMGAILTYNAAKLIGNKKPQIILSDKGIQTASVEFHTWYDITAEEVLRERRGKATLYFLCYNYPQGKVKMDINNLTTGRRALEKLLRVYRGRWNQRRKKD